MFQEITFTLQLPRRIHAKYYVEVSSIHVSFMPPIFHSILRIVINTADEYAFQLLFLILSVAGIVLCKTS